MGNKWGENLYYKWHIYKGAKSAMLALWSKRSRKQLEITGNSKSSVEEFWSWKSQEQEENWERTWRKYADRQQERRAIEFQEENGGEREWEESHVSFQQYNLRRVRQEVKGKSRVWSLRQWWGKADGTKEI